jgi:hypothetical protein
MHIGSATVNQMLADQGAHVLFVGYGVLGLLNVPCRLVDLCGTCCKQSEQGKTISQLQQVIERLVRSGPKERFVVSLSAKTIAPCFWSRGRCDSDSDSARMLFFRGPPHDVSPHCTGPAATLAPLCGPQRFGTGVIPHHQLW